MRLPLRYFGHPDLRAHTQSVKEITPEIVQLVTDMIESMVAYNGVGLAAPQVGRRLRIFVFRDEVLLSNGEYELGEPKVAINPILSNPSQETETQQEGCLSIPGVFPSVTRPLRTPIAYLNLKGETVIEHLEGHRARVVMHENDHLNGVLSVDRTSAKERKEIQPLLQQIKRKHTNASRL